MGDEQSEKIREEARKWVDQLNSGTGLRGTWRLQILDKRVRVRPDASSASSSEGRVSPSPTRIRRFCNAMPWRLVNEAVRYLHETAPYTGLVYNGVPLEGTYAPTRTRWIRDEDMSVDEVRGANGTYTLVQDLVEMRSDAGLEFDGGGTCTETVELRYEWDSWSVEDLPQGGQGVSYAVQGMSRNDDGSFDYVVVKRTARTRVGEWAVTERNEFETVESRVWDNLYGSPKTEWAGDDGQPLSGTDKPPSASYTADTGELVKVDVRQNDDCTWRVVAQRSTPTRNVTSSEGHDRTIFEHTDFRTVRAVDSSDSAMDPVKDAGGGHTYEKKFDLRPDGLHDVVDRVGTEVSVDEAVLERSRTLRAVKVRRTDRNQTASAAADAWSAVLGVGGSVRIEKTPGGLYNVTREGADSSSSVGETGNSCAKTAFRHDHAVTRNQNADPGNVHVADAGGGFYRSRRTRRTDDGTFDVESESHYEVPERAAAAEYRRTMQGRRVSVTDRNQTESYAAAAVKGMRLGDVVRVVMNDGRSFDVTRDGAASSASSVGDTGSRCAKTIFRHGHSYLSNRASRPADHVPEASDGRTVTRTVRMTDNGTYDVTSEVDQEIAVEEAAVEERRTLRGLRRTVQHVNVTESRAADIRGGLDLGRLGTVFRVQKTDGGRRNVTVETPVSSGDDVLVATACSVTAFEHTHSLTRNVPDVGIESSASDILVEERKRFEVRTSKTDEGTVDVQRVDRTARPRTWTAEIDIDKAYGFTRWFRNYTEAEYEALLAEVSAYGTQKVEAWSADDRDPSTYSVDPNVTMNEFGLYDGSVSFGARWAADSAGQYGEKDVMFNFVRYNGTNNWGFNASGRGRKLYEQTLAVREDYGLEKDRIGEFHIGGSFDPTTKVWTVTSSTKLYKGEIL